jgi:hypothetical protein
LLSSLGSGVGSGIGTGLGLGAFGTLLGGRGDQETSTGGNNDIWSIFKTLFGGK